MTTIKTQINGQPFEIEVGEDVEISFSEGKMTIKAKSAAPFTVIFPTYPQPFYPQPTTPHWYSHATNVYTPPIVDFLTTTSIAN